MLLEEWVKTLLLLIPPGIRFIFDLFLRSLLLHSAILRRTGRFLSFLSLFVYIVIVAIIRTATATTTTTTGVATGNFRGFVLVAGFLKWKKPFQSMACRFCCRSIGNTTIILLLLFHSSMSASSFSLVVSTSWYNTVTQLSFPSLSHSLSLSLLVGQSIGWSVDVGRSLHSSSSFYQ